MVDVNQIHDLLEKHFEINENYQINPETGMVSTSGNVRIRPKYTQLPVSFDRVAGFFDCGYGNLESLKGAPNRVGGEFFCAVNSITSLEGAPKHVGGNFSCNSNDLTSLVGSPIHVHGEFDCSNNLLISLEALPSQLDEGLIITYNPKVPLLRLLQYKLVVIYNAPVKVREIMESYAGEGKKAMLNCALELKKHGFVENARW